MGRATKAVTTLALAAAVTGIAASAASTSPPPPPPVGSSGAPIPQGTQSATAYAGSNAGIANVFATTQKMSCFAPEVPLAYPLMTPCGNAANTGEVTSGYLTQAGSNPGFGTGEAMRVTDHSESDIRVDPTNPDHIIGTSKWFVSGPGYNHQLGFYESTDGGTTWNVQGHIPGWEGWTDDTDPVGAFDTNGNFWFLNLAYQFFYDKNGGHNFTVGKSQEPNPVLPAEVIGASVRPAGSTTATDWKSTDIIASYDSKGNEPDKQWLTVDTGSASPFKNRIYAMWVNFHTLTPVPYVSFADANADATHSPWSTPQKLPEPPHVPQGATYLLPHVAPDGTVYTTVTNFNPAHQFGSGATVFIDRSTDGGRTWTTLPGTITIASTPPLEYANTTFRDGIEDTFAVGPIKDPTTHDYPLYVAYEDYSAGVGNVLLTESTDNGATWSPPIQVNDNDKLTLVDEFQPNLSVSPSGTVSVAWYDRRLNCSADASTIDSDSAAADRNNYCINASVQFYHPDLTTFANAPYDHNIRLTQNTWDPQLNSPLADSIGGTEGFIGDYFGNDASVGTTDVFTFVSTYNDGTNPQHYQQQVVAKIATP
jgi:hypothetical protein